MSRNPIPALAMTLAVAASVQVVPAIAQVSPYGAPAPGGDRYGAAQGYAPTYASAPQGYAPIYGATPQGYGPSAPYPQGTGAQTQGRPLRGRMLGWAGKTAAPAQPAYAAMGPSAGYGRPVYASPASSPQAYARTQYAAPSAYAPAPSAPAAYPGGAYGPPAAAAPSYAATAQAPWAAGAPSSPSTPTYGRAAYAPTAYAAPTQGWRPVYAPQASSPGGYAPSVRSPAAPYPGTQTQGPPTPQPVADLRAAGAYSPEAAAERAPPPIRTADASRRYGYDPTENHHVRFYSVGRPFGLKPDPAPIPPQFFAHTADLAADPPGPLATQRTVAADGSTRTTRATDASTSDAGQ